MKGIRLSLKQTPSGLGRLDMSQFDSEKLLVASELDIAHMPLVVDSQIEPLGNWFNVTVHESNSTATMQVEIEGDLRQIDYLGARFRDCDLRVNGSVGDHLGYAMTSGTIVVQGDVGRHCASNLKGGSVTVKGNAGDYAGGARVGDRRGMQGGRLTIRGKAGHHVGHRMRRGTIIIHSDVGSGLGMRMIAGTIVTCGTIGMGLGCGMRRGTILRLNSIQPSSHTLSNPTAKLNLNELEIPGFTVAEESELSFLPILLQDLRSDLPEVIQSQLPASTALLPRRGLRCQGDRAILGLGEVISL